MSLTRLTDLQLQRLASPAKGQKVIYEPTGLGIRISQGGSKSFVVQVGRERKRLMIGRYPDMTLKEARREVTRLQCYEVPKGRTAHSLFSRSYNALVTDDISAAVSHETLSVPICGCARVQYGLAYCFR